MDDTIAAISTPLGIGGIAIVRISGPAALDIADQVFRSPKGKPSDFPTHTLHLGMIHDVGEVLDQAILSIMRRPHSYTGEDTVEVNCHGGVLIAQTILSLVIRRGARLANEGEFTKRAFLNGRMELSQAEAVMDLIAAKTNRAQAAALHAVNGRLGKAVTVLINQLVDILALVEAHIDFPEEEIGALAVSEMQENLAVLLDQIDTLLATATEGRILRHGFTVAIVGRPNVGKSSIMNALVGTDRAIVTPFPGTTRDTLEEYTNLAGMPVCLIDTAGVRTPRGVAEKEGIQRTETAIREADAILQVLDASRKLSTLDKSLYSRSCSKLAALVLNKVDCRRVIELDESMFHHCPVEVSAKQGSGLDQVRKAVLDFAGIGKYSPGEQRATVNQRHFYALQRAKRFLLEGRAGLTGALELEVTARQFRDGLEALSEITGRVTTDDILDRVFSRFCLGK